MSFIYFFFISFFFTDSIKVPISFEDISAYKLVALNADRVIAYRSGETDLFIISFKEKKVDVVSFGTEINTICSGYNGSFFVSRHFDSKISYYDFNSELREEFLVGSDEHSVTAMIFTNKSKLLLFDQIKMQNITYNVKNRIVEHRTNLELISTFDDIGTIFFRKYNRSIMLINQSKSILFNTSGIFTSEVLRLSDDFYISKTLQIIQNKDILELNTNVISKNCITFDSINTTVFYLTNTGEIVQHKL